VVCNSQFVRSGVNSMFGIPHERTVVGYCGVDSRIPAMADVALSTDLPWKEHATNFLLAFATGDEREGYRILPELFSAARAAGYPGKLVIAGTKDAPFKSDLNEGFLRRGLSAEVIWVPFLGSDSMRQLAALYRYADFYLETSRHEGFGMQLLECMACGTTCFSSGMGALSEVGGVYALPLDIYNPSEAGRAVARAWSSGASLRDNSEQVQYARGFDWGGARQIVAQFAWGA
jgi:glycosyltransferase involved in cell wall biosynthesis